MTEEPTTPPVGGLHAPDPLGGSPPRETGRVAYLIDALRRRPFGRRALSTLSIVLFLSGAGMFSYPFLTDVYADQVIQRQIENEFSDPDLRERYITRSLDDGEPLTRIVMPKLGVEAMVVAGTSPAALRAGAGHYPTTALPGEEGNVAIAGHRVTYGKPFNQIDHMGIGDEITLETPIATHTYRVVAAPEDANAPCANGACWVTHPKDWEVVDELDGRMLTLTTCHPKGSARERLILRAELVKTVERDDVAVAG